MTSDECINAFKHSERKEYIENERKKLSFDDVCKKYNPILKRYWISKNLHIQSEVKELKKLLNEVEKAINNKNFYDARLYLEKLRRGGYEIRT